MPTVVGLGNAGEEYRRTRHNIGFEVVRELASRWQWHWVDGGPACTACGTFADQMVVLAQPQYLMNRSGEALAQLDIVHEGGDLIIVHDEIDLPRGCVRVKVGGGTAGHRGVASVAAQYGPEFARIRVGIGRPAPGIEVSEYVLAQFDAEDESAMTAAVRAAADAVECVLDQGRQAAMLRFNTQRPEPDANPSTGDRQRVEGA